jgi:hypothetical protein
MDNRPNHDYDNYTWPHCGTGFWLLGAESFFWLCLAALARLELLWLRELPVWVWSLLASALSGLLLVFSLSSTRWLLRSYHVVCARGHKHLYSQAYIVQPLDRFDGEHWLDSVFSPSSSQLWHQQPGVLLSPFRVTQFS